MGMYGCWRHEAKFTVLKITFDELSMCDFKTLVRFAEWLGVGLPTRQDEEGRRILAKRISRAIKRNQTSRRTEPF